MSILSNQKEKADTQNQEGQPRDKIISLIAGEICSHCLYIAVKLDIAQHLKSGPKTVTELAKLLAVTPDPLYRLLRLLSSKGIFYEGEGKIFSNNDPSLLLLKDHPYTLYTMIIFYKEDALPTFKDFIPALKDGVTTFEKSYGKRLFGYLEDRPERADLFNKFMTNKNNFVVHEASKSFDFGKYRSVYDIGGGYGHFIIAILDQYPEIEGAVYDSPEVIEKTKLETPELVRRGCKLLDGDFFKSVPKGADVYILKSIIHDWTDEESLTILKNVNAAMDTSGRLLLVEIVGTAPNNFDYAKWMDVAMFLMTGGQERTLEEYQKLLEQTGFKIEAIHPTSTEFSIIEASKV